MLLIDDPFNSRLNQIIGRFFIIASGGFGLVLASTANAIYMSMASATSTEPPLARIGQPLAFFWASAMSVAVIKL